MFDITPLFSVPVMTLRAGEVRCIGLLTGTHLFYAENGMCGREPPSSGPEFMTISGGGIPRDR